MSDPTDARSSAGIGGDDLRARWRSNWLRSIQEFSDGDTQDAAWINVANTNPHYSFVELMSCYFDDLGLTESGYAGSVDRGYVSLAEAAALANFHALADAYQSPKGNYDPAAILRDPMWRRVVGAAREVQQALLGMMTEASERRDLVERSRFASAAMAPVSGRSPK